MRLDEEIRTILSRQSDEIGGDDSQFRKLQDLAARHLRYGVSPEAPVRSVLSLVGDKWSVLILGTLSSGRCRYTVLRQLIGVLSYEHEISHRVLAAKLRDIEREGLISRRVTATVPPRVDYELTPLGHSFLQRLESLVSWVEEHYDDILQANGSFDLASPEE